MKLFQETSTQRTAPVIINTKRRITKMQSTESQFVINKPKTMKTTVSTMFELRDSKMRIQSSRIRKHMYQHRIFLKTNNKLMLDTKTRINREFSMMEFRKYLQIKIISQWHACHLSDRFSKVWKADVTKQCTLFLNTYMYSTSNITSAVRNNSPKALMKMSTSKNSNCR